jgi:hypothetical protein
VQHSCQLIADPLVFKGVTARERLVEMLRDIEGVRVNLLKGEGLCLWHRLKQNGRRAFPQEEPCRDMRS